MKEREIAGKVLEFDDENFMVNYKDWDASIATALASEEGLQALNDRHFVVLDFLRKTYEEKGTGPTMRRLTKESGVPTKELYALFPGAPAKKAARIAGIPKPHGCI
ncbi:DsrC like protein [Verrucomicrobiia bacterium DG1235]|nr:DsrC like protein [Verrucomicrobiae bacterium DG1235]